MPIWEWILIAAIAVVVVVSAVVAVSMINFRTKTKRLKQHYGPRYKQAVSTRPAARKASSGNSRRANASARSSTSFRSRRQHSRSSPTAGEKVRARSVDNPTTAVGTADRSSTR